MSLERYVQEFTDPETGEVAWATFEAIEIWTASGWEIIPPGVKFSFAVPEAARKLLKPDEIPFCILREWRRNAGETPQNAVERIFRRSLIKYQRERKNAAVRDFWGFLKNRLRIEVICFMARAWGIVLWYILRK